MFSIDSGGTVLHRRVAKQWTVDDLGREVGHSRSEPPMRYLGRWRIQLAAQQLRNSETALARIAEQVGYESEAAFKRSFGIPPATWRKSVSTSQDAFAQAK